MANSTNDLKSLYEIKELINQALNYGRFGCMASEKSHILKNLNKKAITNIQMWNSVVKIKGLNQVEEISKSRLSCIWNLRVEESLDWRKAFDLRKLRLEETSESR